MPERVKLTKQSLITLVEPSATSEGRLDTSLLGDIYNAFNLPSRAIDGLRTIAELKGWERVACINPRYNNPRGSLSFVDMAMLKKTDLLALSSISRTIPQARKIAEAYRRMRPDGWIVIGGQPATFLPRQVLEFTDIAVRGEGDHAWPEVLEALREGGSAEGVKGTSYLDKAGYFVNEPDRPYLTEAELEQIPWPDFDTKFRNGKRSVNVVIGSRGCPHRCGFCNVSAFYGVMYRHIGNESIMKRIEQLRAELPGKRLFFADDNLAGKPKKAEDLLNLIIERGYNDTKYMSQLRAEIGLHPRIPDLLRRANNDVAAVGIETLNDENLKAMNKGSSAKTTKEGVRGLRDAGVRVHGMFIIGLDGDTRESLMDQLDFAMENVNTAQFCTPMAFAGTEFGQMMADQGRILTLEPQFLSGQDVTIRPKNFTPIELQLLQYEMYERFYAFKLREVFGALADRAIHGPSDHWEAFKFDTAIKLYAWNTARSLRNDPQTIRHRANLKAQS